MPKRAVFERSRRELSLDVSDAVHILLVVEQSSLESQSRECTKTPILTVIEVDDIYIFSSGAQALHQPGAIRPNSLCIYRNTGRPGSSEVPRNPLARWDVSSIPANGIFLTKKQKNKIKMPNGWRTIKSLVHKIRLHSRRGKGMAESFSREKLRHAPQKEGG